MERENVILKREMHKEIVQPFLIAAFKEGAHKKKPPHTSLNRWDRQIMIGVVYNDIGSTATLKELADKHGMFPQSVLGVNKTFLRNLWNNSPLELQEIYPLGQVLATRKPWSLRSRKRNSSSHGGASLIIKAQVESGYTDIGTIHENTGISKRAIRKAASRISKDWGVNLPPSKIALHKKALEQLEKETDDKKSKSY